MSYYYSIINAFDSTVLFVHHRILEEHKLDKKVLVGLRAEQWIGFLGIILIIAGFIIRLI